MDMLYFLCFVESGFDGESPGINLDINEQTTAMGLFQGIRSNGWPSVRSNVLEDHIPMVKMMNKKGYKDVIHAMIAHYLPDIGSRYNPKVRFIELPTAGGSYNTYGGQRRVTLLDLGPSGVVPVYDVFSAYEEFQRFKRAKVKLEVTTDDNIQFAVSMRDGSILQLGSKVVAIEPKDKTFDDLWSKNIRKVVKTRKNGKTYTQHLSASGAPTALAMFRANPGVVFSIPPGLTGNVDSYETVMTTASVNDFGGLEIEPLSETRARINFSELQPLVRRTITVRLSNYDFDNPIGNLAAGRSDVNYVFNSLLSGSEWAMNHESSVVLDNWLNSKELLGLDSNLPLNQITNLVRNGIGLVLPVKYQRDFVSWSKAVTASTDRLFTIDGEEGGRELTDDEKTRAKAGEVVTLPGRGAAFQGGFKSLQGRFIPRTIDDIRLALLADLTFSPDSLLLRKIASQYLYIRRNEAKDNPQHLAAHGPLLYPFSMVVTPMSSKGGYLELDRDLTARAVAHLAYLRKIVTPSNCAPSPNLMSRLAVVVPDTKMTAGLRQYIESFKTKS